MIRISNSYEECLKKLHKTKISDIVKDYHTLCDIYQKAKGRAVEKKSKSEMLTYIIENFENYFTCFIMTLDEVDYNILKEIIDKNKKLKDTFIVDNHEFINILIDKHFIFQDEEDIIIPKDFHKKMKKIIGNKKTQKYIKKYNKLYLISQGIIVAYGVVDLTFFKNQIKDIDELGLDKLKYNYKSNFKFEGRFVISNKLTNKNRIKDYQSNKKYKEFTSTDFEKLGSLIYHHELKNYKKLIRMLKNNYVFKSKDIKYIDKEIVIPYLYNSLNEEETALKNLDENITRLFEFKTDALKIRLMREIKEVKNDFPIWEFRGFSKNEVN